MWLTAQERAALAVIGVMGLAGLGAALWQRQLLQLTLPLGAPGLGEERALGASRTGSVEAARATRWDRALEVAQRVDVNTADAAELERLPEIGPALAKRIVEEREARGPFAIPDDLERVPGIGPKTLEALKDYVSVK